MNKNTAKPEPETAEQPSTGEGFSASDCSAFVVGDNVQASCRIVNNTMSDFKKGEIFTVTEDLVEWVNRMRVVFSHVPPNALITETQHKQQAAK